jgi:hypothetical protein
MAKLVQKSGKHNKSKKNRKVGRNKVNCARYRAEGRREKNKAKKALKRAK